MKKLILTLMILSMIISTLLLSSCACEHTWREATCTAPKTCSKCGATEGTASGHLWKEATCTTPKTCSKCGITEGSASGHIWKEANCTYPETCSQCGETRGTVSGKHSTKQGNCEYCGTFFNELADEVTTIREAFNAINIQVAHIRAWYTFGGTSTKMSAYISAFNNISTTFYSVKDIVNKYPDDFSTLIEPLKNLEEQIESTISRFNSSTSATQKINILWEFCQYYNGPEDWYFKQYQPATKKYYNQQK